MGRVAIGREVSAAADTAPGHKPAEKTAASLLRAPRRVTERETVERCGGRFFMHLTTRVFYARSRFAREFKAREFPSKTVAVLGGATAFRAGLVQRPGGVEGAVAVFEDLVAHPVARLDAAGRVVDPVDPELDPAVGVFKLGLGQGAEAAWDEGTDRAGVVRRHAVVFVGDEGEGMASVP